MNPEEPTNAAEKPLVWLVIIRAESGPAGQIYGVFKTQRSALRLLRKLEKENALIDASRFYLVGYDIED